MARKRFTIHTKWLRSFLFDGWLVKLIMKSFGWFYQGDEIEEESRDVEEMRFHETYATKTTRTETRTKKSMEFRRVSPYSSNLLFRLTELISNIFFFIRNIVRYLVVPAALILLAIGVLTSVINTGFDSKPMFIAAACVVGGYILLLVLPSVILAGLGSLWRKVFKIEDKLRAALRANGYSDDLEN